MGAKRIPRTKPVYADTLEGQKDRVQAAIRAKRKQVEEGGLVFNGVPIDTTGSSQYKVDGAIALFDKDPTLTTIDWEAAPTIWVELDKPTLEAIGIAVGRHVQACYSRSRVLSEAVTSAESAEQLAEVEADLNNGWPSNTGE